MKHLKDLNYHYDFAEEYYVKEIEKFKNDLQKINEPDKLIFEGKCGPTEKKITYNGLIYKGYYKSFEIEVNKNKIGKLECFKSNDNKFFVIYCT